MASRKEESLAVPLFLSMSISIAAALAAEEFSFIGKYCDVANSCAFFLKSYGRNYSFHSIVMTATILAMALPISARLCRARKSSAVPGDRMPKKKKRMIVAIMSILTAVFFYVVAIEFPYEKFSGNGRMSIFLSFVGNHSVAYGAFAGIYSFWISTFVGNSILMLTFKDDSGKQVS